MSHDSFKGRVREGVRHLALLPRAYRLVWGAARGWAVVWIALLLALGLLPALVVYLTRPLIDSITALAGTGLGWDALRPVLTYGGLMGGLLLLSELLRSVLDGVRTAQAALVEDRITGLIHEQSIRVDLAFFESPEYHDQLHRARDQASSRSLALLENTGGLIQNAVSLLALSAVLLPYGAWLPLLLAVSTLPAFLVVVRNQWRLHRWWMETTVQRRRAAYYDQALTSDWGAAEQRLFGWGPVFKQDYQRIRRRLREGQIGLLKDQTLVRFAAGATSLLLVGGALVWMLRQVALGNATLGDLALFYQAFSQGQGILHAVLSTLGVIFTNTLFLASLFDFLELRPEVAAPAAPAPPLSSLRSEIVIEKVSFRYPGSERLSLHGFDLTIPAGRTVAIIGMNGAGKSTLAKLLCRFYDPDEGSICFDGIDIRNFAPEDVRRLITVLFQSPVTYLSSVGYNIAVSDLSVPPDPAATEAAARHAGAHEFIERLPAGYETALGKLFPSGTDLSGGERQRIALARAFYRRAPIVILDEPTSFMDSWAEAEWLDRFRILVQGRTAIVITHRFTTAMRADVIHVMQEGRIVESGTHADLMAQGGLYARSWTAQVEAAGAL